MKENVVELHKNSISSILRDVKGYYAIVVQEDGEVTALWHLGGNLDSQELLKMAGRLGLAQADLLQRYQEAAPAEDLVDL